MLIFIGSYFLLNLMLAVIMESYINSEEEELVRMENELEEEKNLMIQRMNENHEKSYSLSSKHSSSSSSHNVSPRS